MSHITLTNTVSSVAGKTGSVSLVKGDVGLGNVDNTSDANKPVSTAQAAAIAAQTGTFAPLTSVDKWTRAASGGFTHTAISNALDAAAGGEVLLRAGDYMLGNRINRTDGLPVRLTGEGPDRTRLVINHTNTAGAVFTGDPYANFIEALNISGSKGAPVLLTADAAHGDMQITLASTTGITSGTRLLVRSTALWPGTDKEAKRGEIVRVASVSGLVVTLAEPVEDTAYLVSDGALAEKLNLVRGVVIRDLTIAYDGTAGSAPHEQLALLMSYCEDPIVENVWIDNIDGRGILPRTCLGGRILGPRFRNLTDRDELIDPTNAKYGYGVAAADATRELLVEDAYMRGGRHLYTTIGYGAGGVVSEGVPRHCTISNSIARDTGHASFDTHVEGFAQTFNDCRAIGGRTAGMQLRALRSVANNFKAENIRGAGVRVRCSGTALRNTEVAWSFTDTELDGSSNPYWPGIGIVIDTDQNAGPITDVRLEGKTTIRNTHEDGLLVFTGSDRLTVQDLDIRTTGTHPTRGASHKFGVTFAGTSTGHRFGRVYGDDCGYLFNRKDAGNTIGDTQIVAYELGAAAVQSLVFTGFTLTGPKVPGPLQFVRPASTDFIFQGSQLGDAQTRFAANASGLMNWGSGSAVRDTNLYRSAAGVLATDNAFLVTGAADGADLLKFATERTWRFRQRNSGSGAALQLYSDNDQKAFQVSSPGHKRALEVTPSDTAATAKVLLATDGGNVGINAATGSFGSGVGVVFVGNAGTAPTTNPTAGGVLYAEAGALKWRGSSGTVTTIAPA